MRYNTRGSEVVNVYQKMGSDVSNDQKVVLRRRKKSNTVLPMEDTESHNAPFSQSLNSKEFQDSPHEQNLKTMKPPQKFGTACIVTPENKKVMAPRNWELTTKTLEKDSTEDLKEIDDKQLTTDVETLDEFISKYHPDGDLWSVDIRVPNPSKATETENTNFAVEELLIPLNQASQSSDQFVDSDLKNVQLGQVSLASTSTENCPQTQSLGADLSEVLQLLPAGFWVDSEMCQEASFKDDTEMSHSQGTVYQLDDEMLLSPEAGIGKKEMLEMGAVTIQSDPAKNCKEDADCSTNTIPSDHHMGFDYESVMDQEMTSDYLPEEIPRDTFSLGDIVYESTKAVEDSAQSHDHHLLKTDVHGVYTDRLSSQPLLDSMLIPESTGAEMKRVLQGMLKFDVKEGSSAKDTMMLIKAMSAKDQNTSLPESTVEENVVAQKKIQSARPRARRRRGKKRQEVHSSTPQIKMTQKSEQILAENPQLKKRMVKGELKRKLLMHSSAIPDKVIKPMEPDLEMRESSRSGSVSDGMQMRMSADGNQQTELLQGGDRAGLLTDGSQTGSSTPGSQRGLSAQGNQTGFLMQGIQVALSTNGNQTGFWNLGGFSEDYLPLEQPFSEVQISENHQPIRQADDGWPIQESNQEPEPAGNMPDLGCLGID